MEKAEQEELLEGELDEDVLQSKLNVVNLHVEPANSKMSSQTLRGSSKSSARKPSIKTGRRGRSL